MSKAKRGKKELPDARAAEPMVTGPARSAWIGPVFVVALTVALLLPFVNKAYHIDDALFLRLARQVREHPFAPYSMQYNWGEFPQPFWEVTQNPPLDGYLIALVSLVSGLREWGMHLAFIAIAAGCSLLMYSLAKRFCRHPVLATAATIATPGFLVSASNVMADVPLLFFWLLAIWLAVRYAETSRPLWLWGAGVAAAAAAMTKYFGAALVPLLLVYCIPYTSRRRIRLLPLLLPVLVLAAWGTYASAQSGRFHPLTAAVYSQRTQAATGVKFWDIVGPTMTFLGGSLVWPIFFLVFIIDFLKWLRRNIWIGVGFIFLGTMIRVIASFQKSPPRPATEMMLAANSPTWLYFLMVLAGGMAIFLTIVACVTRRDWPSVLLGLWFFGTLAFCLFFNWTINVRIWLPGLFPVALCAARWLETLDCGEPWTRRWAWSLAAIAGLALWISAADYEFAGASRTFAQTTIREYIHQGRRVWFVGHWGHQYYLEREGALPVNFQRVEIKPSDLIVYATFNSYSGGVDAVVRQVAETGDLYANPYGVHTMDYLAGSGFYSTIFGPLPYGPTANRFADHFAIDERVEPKSPPKTKRGDRPRDSRR